MQFEGVHHVSLNVSDLEAATRFYVEVLELAVLPRPDFDFAGLWLDAGGQQVHLIQRDGWVAPRGQHFALRVSDVDAACAAVRARGVEVSDPIDIPSAGRQAFLHDPSGNLIELNQPS